MSKRRQALQFFGLTLFLAGTWYLSAKFVKLDTGVLENSLKSFPLIYSCVIYVVAYVIITFFIFLSKDIFWLAGAVVFGVKLSTLLISISEVINAFILFYLARKFGRAFIEKKAPVKYRYLDEKLGRLNFGWLLIFRVAPLIPYRFMDLAAGLTKIDFRKYIVAAILGTPIKMLWVQYVIFGVGQSILTDPNAMVEYFLRHKIMLACGLIYLILVILVIIKMKSKD